MNREVYLILGAVAISVVLKGAWAIFSAGSSDAYLFFLFGKALQHGSLRDLYQDGPLFNHTPLTGLFVKWLCALSQSKFEDFSTLLRLPGIVADVLLTLGLVRVRQLTGQPPLWAVIEFAFSPVSLMVTGFHGNMDPIMVAFLFWAGVAVELERPALSGFLFALACNVKMMPIFFAPVFLFFWWARGAKAVARFAIPFIVVLLAGIVVPLVECPAAFYRNVFGYSGYWGGWGVTYWLRATGFPVFQTVNFAELDSPQKAIMATLKYLVIAATALLGWRRRNIVPEEFLATMGAAWVVLFVFAPGAAVQYMVWFAPFVLILSARWWVALTAASTVFMFLFYHSASQWKFPWYFAFPTDKEVHIWSPWSNLPWAIFIAFFCAGIRQWWNPALDRMERESAEAAPVGV